MYVQSNYTFVHIHVCTYVCGYAHFFMYTQLNNSLSIRLRNHLGISLFLVSPRVLWSSCGNNDQLRSTRCSWTRTCRCDSTRRVGVGGIPCNTWRNHRCRTHANSCLGRRKISIRFRADRRPRSILGTK